MAEGATRDKLVEDNLGLVRALAAKEHKKVGKYIEFDELVSMGTTGLLEAADRYDADAGVQFSTFAYYRVRGAIIDGVRKNGHLPRTEYDRLKAAQRADEYLESVAARETAARQPGQPAAASSTEDELRSMYEALQNVATIFVTSLDAHLAEGHEIDGGEVAADERLAFKQLRQRIVEALAELPERERHFIQKHYFEGKTLLEAGKELGLSKSWSSRLHARAVELLRERLVANRAIAGP